jgi:hypothetical protein
MRGTVINCENMKCNKEFVKTHHNSRFCGRSCSNVTIKRRGYNKKISACTYCGDDVEFYTNVFCKGCRAAGRHWMKSTGGKLLTEVTIEEYCPRKGANAYDNIRANARKSVKDELKNGCEECGWSHHVEVCHIKAISDYPDDTIVSVVNERHNLKLLCPNCHWVFDH